MHRKHTYNISLNTLVTKIFYTVSYSLEFIFSTMQVTDIHYKIFISNQVKDEYISVT